MQFKDIVGQRNTINRMIKIADGGRIPHAQMLVGASREGSLALALAYLQYICCDHKQHYTDGDLHADSCGQCPSCKKISSIVHPDLHLIFPTATTDSVKKNPYSELFVQEFANFIKETHGMAGFDEWFRTLGIEKKQGEINTRDASYVERIVGMKSYEGGWKMILVWMADRMNSTFANKLLKTLEEPTPQTLILLVAESDEHMLPTVRSRVQSISMEPTKKEISDEDSERYATTMVQWLRLLFKLKMTTLSAQVDNMSTMNREELCAFLTYSLEQMRRCFLQTEAAIPCSLKTGDERFDSMFPTMITKNNISLIDDAINDAIFAIGRNANSKIALMELSFRMSKALKKR